MTDKPTTFWPKRDEDGQHVTGECDLPELPSIEKLKIGSRLSLQDRIDSIKAGGPVINYTHRCEPDPVETLKPLSELLDKLDPEVVERALREAEDEVAKESKMNDWVKEFDYDSFIKAMVEIASIPLACQTCGCIDGQIKTIISGDKERSEYSFNCGCQK